MKPSPPDMEEPWNAMSAVAQCGLIYIVTFVDFDDCGDGSARYFAQSMKIIKQLNPELFVECLMSYFSCDHSVVEILVL